MACILNVTILGPNAPWDIVIVGLWVCQQKWVVRWYKFLWFIKKYTGYQVISKVSGIVAETVSGTVSKQYKEQYQDQY